MATPFLVAQAWRPDWDIVLAAGALIVLVALGVWAVVKVRQWRQDETPEAVDPFAKMAEDGLLDPDELARVKSAQDKQQPIPHEPPAASQPPDASIQE